MYTCLPVKRGLSEVDIEYIRALKVIVFNKEMISLCFLKVGLAVGDIDAIQSNAAISRYVMQVRIGIIYLIKYQTGTAFLVI